MTFLRNHWYDVGGVFGVVILVLAYCFRPEFSAYQLLMWLSLASLFFHQVEEYRIPGTFPGMINRVMFHSDLPGRYPLNSNTALVINVALGWTIYLAAAIAGERLVWLGVVTMMVSLGNIVAHTVIFNLRGKTRYNAGLLTSWLFFAPCIFCFIRILSGGNIARVQDYLIGIPLGIIVNVFLIFKMIGWLADRNTGYAFGVRNLLPADRQRGPDMSTP